MKNTPISKRITTLLIGAFMLSGFVAAGQLGMQFSWDSYEAESVYTPTNSSTLLYPQNPDDPKKEKDSVCYISDVTKKVENDTITRQINAAFTHNGAIIVCDSALHYDANHFECLGNVVIYQDSTYIYGDRVTYDGIYNIATVHSPLIKITSGTSTVMYTFNLIYDTRAGIASFSNGAIIMNKDNFMEAVNGDYYSKTNDIKLLKNVSMRNSDYEIRTDSLKFNLDTEVTTFLTKTYIWDNDRDFLTADGGNYDRKTQTYTFTKNAYILTPDQEMWADSIIYHSETKEAFMRRNVQILDTAQKTLAFGDWAYYNDSLKKGILSNKPSVRSWEKDGDTVYMKADSIYFETFPLGTTKPDSTLLALKAQEAQEAQDKISKATSPFELDSLGKPILDSLGKPIFKKTDSTESRGEPLMDSLGNIVLDSLGRPIFLKNRPTIHNPPSPPLLDSIGQPIGDTTTSDKSDKNLLETLQRIGDSSIVDSVTQAKIRNIEEKITDSTDKSKTAHFADKEEKVVVKKAKHKKEQRKRVKTSKKKAPNANKNSIDTLPSDTTHTRSKADSLHAKASDIDSLDETNSMKIPMLDSTGNEVINSQGKVVYYPQSKLILDSTGKPMIDSLGNAVLKPVGKLRLDSLGKPIVDSQGYAIYEKYRKPLLDTAGQPLLDSLGNPLYEQDLDSIQSDKTKKDTVERLIRAFSNVRLYRKDFQMACDSLVGYSVDSTASLFGRPILWNEDNQITADQIDVYSKDEDLDWADFIGTPFIIQRIDSARYNQARGRSMQAFFKDNEVDYTHMHGDVINYYYWQEDDDEVVGFASMESAELEMFFEKRKPVKMNWIGQAEWVIFPIDQIPSEQATILEGFDWNTELRPRSNTDICTRTELPSKRAEVEAYEKPTFPLEKQIKDLIQFLVKGGTWRDRIDKPSHTPEYIIEQSKML